MNPTDWQYTHQRQWESLDPRRRTDSRQKTEMSNNITPGKATDPDGEPVSNVDGELARKLRELQQIEEHISLKKATISMKTTETFFKAKTPYQMFKIDREEDLSLSKVDSSVKNTQPFMSASGKYVGFSCSTWSSAYNNGPLKERVNVILQQRCPGRFLAKAFSSPYDHHPLPNPVEKTNMLTLNQDDHPLKLRMKALMNRRRSSGVLDSHGEVPVVKTHPPSQSPSTTVVGNDLVVQGFQRFLNVLNKVVDIEVLTKIVNDDKEHHLTGEEILHSQPPVVKEKSDFCKRDSQQLQRGVEQKYCQSYSEERKTELRNQDNSHRGVKRNIQREEESVQSDDAGSRNLVSSRISRSPPVVEKKKPKLEQHQEHLQSILKTIGFSLDADDMCKLTERTQERLYGRKNETKQRLDNTGESKRIQQHVQSDHSRSSSSTSVSDSPSSSPSHHQHSPSKTFRDSREQTQTSNSRQKSRDQARDVSPDPSPENPEYHVPYPDAASAIPTYIFDAASAIPTYNSGAASAIPTYSPVQHSEYTAYHTYHNNGAPSIAWNYGPNAILPSSYSYPPGFCNSVNNLCPSNTGALPAQVYPHPHLPAAPNNALGHSCQTGQQSGPQYHHVINTGRSNGTVRYLTQVDIKPQGQMHQVQTRYLHSGITTNALRPEQPVVTGTKVQQKKTAINVVNTETSSGPLTARCLTQRTKHSTETTTKSHRRAKRKANKIKKQNKMQRKIEQSKVGELMTPAVALGSISENSQKDPAQMQSSNSPCGITTNTLCPEPPEEAGTEVQQKKTATHVLNTETSSGTVFCQQLNQKPKKRTKKSIRKANRKTYRMNKMQEQPSTDVQVQENERDIIHVINTRSQSSGTAHCLTQLTEMKIDKMEFATFEAYKYAVWKQYKEMKKLESTASWIGRYIRVAKSNRNEYSESAQQENFKKLLRRKRRIDILREENKRELDALNSYPLDKFSTEAKQLEGELPTVNSDLSQTEQQQGHTSNTLTDVNIQRKEAKIAEQNKRTLAALAACSVVNDEKDPAQMGKSKFPSGNTTNNLSPELPGEDKSEAGQMERALPTEEQIKANLKKKLAAFNQKMKQQVLKPTETQPNANDW